MKNIILILFTLICVNTGYSQRDSVVVLEEVVLTDSKLRNFSDGIKLTTLTDSVLELHRGMLTDNLRFNTPIFFKENGFAMVSSASFRGTSAQQTAVVWNGININSQLTGQTDFNALMLTNIDEITVRSGGGSTQYGTGAVGGSIHANNQLVFDSVLKNKLSLGYGSFATRSFFYKAEIGKDKVALSIGLGHFASENDFKYLGTNQKNENGAFNNNAIDIAFGIQVSEKDMVKFYNATFFGNRDFSGTLTALSNDNYRDFNSRSLLEWVNYKHNRVQRVRSAYLFERYKYYPNKESDDFSFGRSANVQLEYDYTYRFKKWAFNGIVTANSIKAEGSSIQTENRKQLAAILLLSHKASDKLSYGLNLRKDWVSDYESPFVISIDGSYQVSKKYSIRANASKNFRVPTFNDLYWQGAGAIGNLELAPESAYQAELGQTLLGKGYEFNLTGFYIASSDLIQWRPNLLAIWSPVNVKEAKQYGLEFEMQFAKKLGKHLLQLKNGYSYTKALDTESEKQLLYVPLHKFTSNLAYSHSRWGAYVQGLYNGSVFTTTDNSDSLKAYFVIDMGLEYEFPKISGIALKSSLVIKNLANKNYQNVAFRPMPNRNIHVNLNFKF